MIYLSAKLSRCIHLRPSQVFLKISLAGQITDFDGIVVHKLKVGYANRRQLNGNLPANGPDTDNGCFSFQDSVPRDNVLLS